MTETQGAGTGTAGAGSTGSTGSDEPKKKSAPLTASESDAQYAVQLARFGNNHEMLARQLWGEQLTARRRNREIRDERDALRSRNPQGSVVLIGEDVTKFNAWKQLGTPEELRAKIESLTQIQAELAQSKRTAARAATAKALNWNAAVLSDRLDLASLDVEVREEPDGKGVKQPVAYTRKAGSDAAWEKLAEVAERDWKDHLPALKATGSATATAPTAPVAPLGIPFPNNGAGSATAGSIVDRHIANRDKQAAARPNPLGAKGTAQKSA